ncbi:MAG: flagellar hook protein FliD, partial [Spirochaetes bacterium]
EQQRVWQEVNRKLARLQESAKKLYSFESPFKEKVASTTDESVLRATATREARETEIQIKVLQIAKADRFLSASLPDDYMVPQGEYGFAVGEEKLTFSFEGGDLQAFARELTDRGKGLINASVVKDTGETQVIQIESDKTGSKNRVTFLEDSVQFGLDTGMLTAIEQRGQSFRFSDEIVRPWTKPLNGEIYAISDNTLTLFPGGELSLPLRSPISETKGLVLEVEVTLTEIEKEKYEPPPPPPGPQIPDPGSITFEDINIKNRPSQVELPEWKPPPPPEVIKDMQVLFAQTSRGVVPLPSLKDITGTQKISIPLSDFIDNISAINIRNNNTNREISFKNLSIFDPELRGEYKPSNPISQASDALISLNGIEVKRESNIIDDLIPGVSLELVSESEKSVNLKVEPDRETIKEKIITLVGNYNQLLTDLHILTRVDESIIEDIEYFTEEERKAAREKLGLLQGDITLNQLKSRLQTIMMNSYPTNDEINLLARIGISTSAARPGTTTALRIASLRGYLEINEDVLDEMLRKNLPAVEKLFGFDSNGDLIVDSGVAYSIDSYGKPYTQSGGIIGQKIQNLNSRISQTNTDIENYNRRLESKEAELRREFGMMEGALQSLEESSRAIQNLNRERGRD